MPTRRERFFGYFQDQLAGIEQFGGRELKIHRKILYVAFVDSLSGLIFPTSGNRDRFTETVRQLGGWQDADRVSTPHLVRALRLNADPSYNRVRELASANMAAWTPGDLIPIKRDLEAGVVGTHWPTGKRYEQPVEGAPWSNLKHGELLYAYRNALVHGFRALGSDAELDDDVEPYYLGVHDMDRGGAFLEEVHWELIYPSGFLKALAANVLQGVRIHIERANLDPVEILRGGKFWLRELNL